MPHGGDIAADADSRQDSLTGGIGDFGPGRVRDMDIGGHVVVDIAADRRRTRLVEDDGLGPLAGILQQLERANRCERVDMVANGVVVVEDDGTPGADRHHRRHEGLVALIDRRGVGLGCRWRHRGTGGRGDGHHRVGQRIPSLIGYHRRHRRSLGVRHREAEPSPGQSAPECLPQTPAARYRRYLIHTVPRPARPLYSPSSYRDVSRAGKFLQAEPTQYRVFLPMGMTGEATSRIVPLF